jgi:hypothetical protein
MIERRETAEQKSYREMADYLEEVGAPPDAVASWRARAAESTQPMSQPLPANGIGRRAHALNQQAMLEAYRRARRARATPATRAARVDRNARRPHRHRRPGSTRRAGGRGGSDPPLGDDPDERGSGNAERQSLNQNT